MGLYLKKKVGGGLRNYLVVLVASVFLGTELLAIPTPLAQITPYRLLVMGAFLIFAYQLFKGDSSIKVQTQAYSTVIVAIFAFWWLWGIFSGIWSLSLMSWIQAMFLLSLGVGSIIAVYLWTEDQAHWHEMVNLVWLMMTFLALWGLYEIITNHYIFADLAKLDKYNTFTANPWARIPITIFANQNDYATMLLAYLPLNLIKINLSPYGRGRFFYLITIILTLFLVYRSESRMIFLSLFLFFIIYALLQLQWDISLNKLLAIAVLALIASIIIFSLVPALRAMLDQLFHFAGDFVNTGDSRRINLWRNGLLFLGQTFGFGVGAGHIEVWMEALPFLPIDEFTNIHNWWLEVLVGYGVVVFMLYIIAYGLLIHSFFRLRRSEIQVNRQIANAFISFLLVYIFASITSANNMLIEWHWVYFALMIAFIKVNEIQSIAKVRKKEVYL